MLFQWCFGWVDKFDALKGEFWVRIQRPVQTIERAVRQPRTWCSRVWEKMLVAQTAAMAGLNQHSAARNAFVFVLKADNIWFVPQQYSSASEHIHNMFAACLLTVYTSEHHVLGCRIRLCRGICSIVCTGLNRSMVLFKVNRHHCNNQRPSAVVLNYARVDYLYRIKTITYLCTKHSQKAVKMTDNSEWEQPSKCSSSAWSTNLPPSHGNQFFQISGNFPAITNKIKREEITSRAGRWFKKLKEELDSDVQPHFKSF